MPPRKPPKAVLPLAPHGLPGHLVGFVEALREQGISVGPSETVDAGRVMTVLGLQSRSELREGLACAVLRRADHRPTFDVLFDLWFPPALGARFIEVGEEGIDIDDIEQVRDELVDLLASDAGDLPLNSLIAQIVEAYGKYNSTRGTSYSAYQAMKSLSLDQIEAKLLTGLLGGGDEDSPVSPTDQAVAKAIAKERISKVRQLVEAETKRRTAEQLGRERVTAYGVPQLAENVEFLRASGSSCATCAEWCIRWRGCWPVGSLPGAGVRTPARSICVAPCASPCPPVVCRSTSCRKSPGPRAPSWWCFVTCQVRWPVSRISPCCWSMRCVSSSRGCASLRSSTPPTR